MDRPKFYQVLEDEMKKCAMITAIGDQKHWEKPSLDQELFHVNLNLSL